jgi:DoxX-like family
VLGALGLMLPAALGIQEWLTPLAAAGLALMMIGAVVVHLRRGEAKVLAVPFALVAVAAALAALRFGPYPL